MDLAQEIEKLSKEEKVRFEERVDDTLDARTLLWGQLKEKYSTPEMTNLKETVYHYLFD